MTETKSTIYEGNELLPPADHPEVGLRVAELLTECLDSREDLGKPKEWTRFYELRKNKHWKAKSGTKLNLVSANLLGSHHQKTVNMLTDNNPTFNSIQTGELAEDSEEGVEILSKTGAHWWGETEQQHRLETSVSTGETYGTVGEKASFNPDIDKPNGEVEIETIDPFYICMYPPRCKEIEKAEGLFHIWPMTTREARRRWEEKADDIQGDLELLSELGDERENAPSEQNGITTTLLNSVVRFLSGSKSAARDDSDETIVIEGWVKDHSVDGNGDPLYIGNIRRVMCCSGGNVVLSDDNNPSINPDLEEEDKIKSYLFNRFPFSWTQSVTDPDSPFGMADYEQLAALNLEINKTLSQFTRYKDKATRLKLINPKNSGVTNQELDNIEGIIRPTNHVVAQAIRYMDGPKVPADIVTALSVYKDLFHEVSGTFSDVNQGRNGGSDVIAYKAIAALLEEATRMLKGKIRNYSKMIRERGRMYISLAQNFYHTDRYISFKKDGKDQVKAVSGELLRSIPGKITVVSGSTMPVSQIQKREEALALYDKRVIDQEELLKCMDWPERMDVIKRMQAGPLGEFLSKLGMIGVPKEMLQYFHKLGQTETKELEKLVKAGEVVTFQKMIQEMMSGGQQQQPNPEMIAQQIEGAKAQADIQLTNAKIREVEVKIALEQEKIATERLEQQIKIKGVGFDEEKMVMTRSEVAKSLESKERADRRADAEAVANIKDKTDGRHIEKVKVAADIKSKTDTGPTDYNERGLTSNNQGD